jgi:hypothetical protein
LIVFQKLSLIFETSEIDENHDFGLETYTIFFYISVFVFFSCHSITSYEREINRQNVSVMHFIYFYFADMLSENSVLLLSFTFIRPIMDDKISTGTGKMIVLLFSADMLFRA